jgi:hypothetical protein
MFKKSLTLFLSLLIVLSTTSILKAGDTAGSGTELPKGLQGVSIGGLYYLAYQAGQEANGYKNYNKFSINRGYLTVKKTINPNLSARITLDTYQDNNIGNSSGSYVVRLKYAYAQFNLPAYSILTNPFIEFGMAHMPWLDFEEHLNFYRMQGTMFMERVGIFNSADMGFTFNALLGGKISDEYQKSVNKNYPGKYGSFSFGIYNGGGYHASEKNQTKFVETRLTIRPLPEVAPGLQASYFGVFGKGNLTTQEDLSSGDVTGEDDIYDWNTNALLLSYESKMLVLTGQTVMGQGNQKGDWSDDANYSGYSAFAEGKLTKNWRAIARYDIFDPDTDIDDDGYNRMIIGGGYDFGGKNILLVDYEVKSYQDSAKDTDSRFSVTIQVNY